MPYLSEYPIEKRKKIALWCAIGFGIVLIGILILVYTQTPVAGEKGLSVMISSGYTTLIENAQSYFAQK